MKKVIIYLLLLFFVVPYSYSEATNDPNTKSTDHFVLTKENPSYVLRLTSNPTTGFRWLVVSYDKDLLRLESHKFVAPTDKKLMGAPGHEEWAFSARAFAFAAPQVTTIKLVYARPWEYRVNKSIDIENLKTVTVVIE